MFTTHTPVPAGHDAFPFHLVEKHLAGCWGTLGANRDRFLALGAYDNGGGPQFNMTALALRSAGSINAVSQLHGEVTRAMWAPMWPDVAGSRAAGRARSPTACTCRRGSPADLARPVRDATSAPTGSTATTTRRCGTACWRFPTRSCGRVRQSLRRYLFTFVRERARQRWIEEHVGIAARRRRRHAARSRRADDRLRAPLHRLQAAGADLPRSRAARAHPERAPAGRCRSSSPASRIRPTTSASTTCSASTGARSIRCSAAASRSSTTTTCTSRTSSCRAATSG